MSFNEGHVGVTAPRLLGLDVESVCTFLQDRKKYLLQVTEKNVGLQDDSKVVPVSLEASISDSVLRTIKVFRLGMEEDDDLTEEELLVYLEEIAPTTLMNTSLTQLPSLLEQFIVDPGKKYNPVERVEAMWISLNDLILRYHLADEFSKKPYIKLVRTTFAKAIKHPRLKERLDYVFNSVGLLNEVSKRSLRDLFKVLIDCSEQQMIEDCSKMELDRSSGSVKRKRTKSIDRSVVKRPRMNEEAKKRRYGANYIPPEHRSFDRASRKTVDSRVTKQNRSLTCWNCGEIGHKSNECTKSISHRREAQSGQANNKAEERKGRANAVRANLSGSCKPAMLNNYLEVTVLADSGASTSYICKNTALRAGLNISKSLNTRKVNLALAGVTAKVCGTAKSDIEIEFMGHKVMIRRVTFTVLKDDMDFVLIGEDVLELLGISPFHSLNEKIKANHYSYVFDFLVGIKKPKQLTEKPVFEFDMEGKSPSLMRSQSKISAFERTNKGLSDPEEQKYAIAGVEAPKSGWHRPPGLLREHESDLSERSAKCHRAFASLDRLDDDDRQVNNGDALTQNLQKALDDMIDRAAKELTENEATHINSFRKLVYKYADIWRVDLEHDHSGAAKVTPLSICLKSNARPRRAHMRRYNLMEQKFLSHMTEKLLKNGSIYRNRRSRWSSPSYVVKKPGRSGNSVEDYRWTIDLRYVNSQCDPIAGSMPILENMVQYLQGARVFAQLDAHKGYWQFPLSKDSQEVCSFITHEGVFSPTRLLQGHQDSVVAFQSGMEEALGELLRVIVLCWIDDLLVYENSVEGLIHGLDKVFEKMRKFNIKLSPSKSNLLARSVKWCGKRIDKDGVEFDREMIQGLVEMSIPKNAAELQQLLCGSNWLRVSLPGYAAVVSDLQELLRKSKRFVQSSKKTRLQSVGLNWNEKELIAFHSLKDLLQNAVKLAHFRLERDWSLNLFTDASDRHWGVVLTQCPVKDLQEDILQQKHEPLAFLSGSFSGSQLNWSTIEKEAFPIIESLNRLRHFLSVKHFKLFTDHRNLTYIFSEYMRASDVNKQVVDKLMRWHIKLQAFNYTIEHVAGKMNLWADLLSRWRVVPSLVAAAHMQEGDHANVDQQRSIDQSVNQNYENEVIQRQQDGGDEFELLEAAMDGVNSMDYESILKELQSLKLNRLGQLVVEDKKLMATLITLAHCGMSAHRGVDHTLNRLKDRFYWKNMAHHVKKFVQRCLHCLSCKTSKVKSLLSQQMHASERNMVLHYDFLYVFKKYVLVIKDDFSHFVELSVCDTCDHIAVVQALLGWNSRYGLRRGSVHVSDQGSHFKNNVCRELERMLGIHHRFTIAHTPYSNGTVEIVNRHILRILRTLRSEFKVNDWESLIPLVQACLNLNRSPTLGNLAPTEVFTGMEVEDPVSVLFDRSADVLVGPLDANALLKATADLQRSMERIHKELAVAKRVQRDRRLGGRNRGRSLPNYAIGDFVLVHIPHPKDKCSSRFDGPYRVVDTVSDHVYVVEHLLSDVRKRVHVERILFFTIKDAPCLKKMKEHVLFHKSDSYEVEDLLELRMKNGVREVLVKWMGFEEYEATWEPLDVITQDLPEMVRNFLDKQQNL